MPAPFPLIKLAAILFKQISKPIANMAKEKAKSSPFFRTYVCMPPAQLYNWCEIKLKMWVLNLGKPVNIPVLSEQMAIELGANLLGESIVFTVATGIVVAEYFRSANKDAAKEAARKEEINNLTFQLQELYFKVEQQDAQIREMQRSLVEISPKKSFTSGLLGPSWHVFKDKASETSSTPPSVPVMPVIVPISANYEDIPEDMGVILAAVHRMERDIVGVNEFRIRENGFLTNALMYIENDVCRRPVAV